MWYLGQLGAAGVGSAVTGGRKRVARAVLAFGTALVLGACAAPTVSSPGAASAVNSTNAARPVGARRADVAIVDPGGADKGLLDQIRRQFGPLYRNRRMEVLIVRVGRDLVAGSAIPGQRYRLGIIDSPAINAFAIPVSIQGGPAFNGYLFMTRGLLALANDTSEVGAVLAHEMAHITLRHGASRQTQGALAAIVAGVVGRVFDNQIAQAAINAAGQLTLAQFSQQQEIESDQIGIASLAKAGYDPQAAVRFLGSLNRHQSLTGANRSLFGPLSLFSSHPPTPQRITKAFEVARVFVAKKKLRRGRDRYLNALDRLRLGPLRKGQKPFIIRVLPVRRGDTARGFARRMAEGGDKLKRFLVLNGLDDQAGLKALRRVKIVSR